MIKIGTLLLTHSSRITNLNQCSLNYFYNRYSDLDRLKNAPPFSSLPPISAYRDYFSALSFLHVYMDVEVPERMIIKYAGNIKGKRRIQHAVQVNDYDLLIAYTNGVDLWRCAAPIKGLDSYRTSDFTTLASFDHPHFEAIHSVFPIDSNSVVVSASAPDSIFILNLASGKIETSLRMPHDLYGFNYALTPDMNLSDHYISNDLQMTHINSAYPLAGGRKFIVSTLIQGAIGEFDLDTNSYRELTRGFIGCHGARVNSDNIIYFADSANGNLIFIDNNGQIIRRFGVDSRWLHDVQQVSGPHYAFCLADRNEIRVYDIDCNLLVFKKQFPVSPFDKHHWLLKRLPFWVGNSTQFFSYFAYR